MVRAWPTLKAPQRNGRSSRSLDEVIYYVVYKDGVDAGHPVTTTFDDVNGSVGENIPHSYYVSAMYTGNIESGSTATVNQAFNNSRVARLMLQA